MWGMMLHGLVPILMSSKPSDKKETFYINLTDRKNRPK